MRLLFIILGTVAFFVMTLLTLRFWGLGLRHQEFQHDFYSASHPYIFQIQNVGQANDVLHLSSDAPLWLDVRITKDHQFFVQDPGEAMAILTPKVLGKNYQGGKPYFYDYAFIKSLFPDLKTVEDFLIQYPNQRFVLNIIDNAESIHKHLQKTLKDHNPEKRLLIHSEVDVVIDTLKKEQPFWLYGMTLPELTRLTAFDSIGLAPAIEIRGDVLVSPIKRRGRSLITASLLEEIQRRKKKVFLGPLESDSEIQMALEFYNSKLINGFVLSNSNQWKILDAQLGNQLPESPLPKIQQ